MAIQRLPHDIEYYKRKRHEEIRKERISRRIFNAIKKKKGIIVAFAVAFLILLLPIPKPFQYGEETIVLTQQGKSAIALLALFIIIFVTEAMPFGMTIAVVYCWIVIFGVIPPRNAADIFSHDAVWFLVGALMISSVLIRHGIHMRALGLILKLAGAKIRWVVFGIVLFCAVTSMFIADHTMAAVMLPVGIAIVNQCGGFKKVPRLAKCIMLAIAFGASIGGLATPSGGGRNVVMIGFLQDYFDVNVTYWGWMVMAAPLTLVLVPVVTIILLIIFHPEVDHINHVQEKLEIDHQNSKMSLKQWSSLAIFLLIFVLWVFRSDLGIGMIAMLGSLIYIILGLADWDDFQSINWSTVMLYFAAIGLGRALQETMATRWLAAHILGTINDIGITSGFPLTASSAFFMTAMTQTMSGGPCVASIGPMLLEAARLAGNDPVVFGIAITISVAFAFAIVIGTPPNAIVYGSGYLKAKDFLKTGIVLSLIAYGLLLVTVFFWWGLLRVGINGFH